MVQPGADIVGHTVQVGQVLGWIQIAIAVICVPSIFRLVRRLSEIRDHLAKINGNVQEINQWRADHDKRVEQEERHHDQQHAQCAALHGERMNNVMAQLQQLWGRVGDRRRPNMPTD